jgi:hypothetical protein
MPELTTEQLAQLILGIARAQHAIVEAVESARPGFKATHLRPTIETAARLRTNRPETLAEYPSRLLLQMLGRSVPDAAAITRELDRLITQTSAPSGAPSANSAANTNQQS